MLRSRFIAAAIVMIGLIPAAFGTSTLAPKLAGPTTFEVLADVLSHAHGGPALINHPGGTPVKRFQPSDTRNSNAFFVLLDSLQPAPGNGDESAWLYHAWEIRQDWDQVVVVAEIRKLRTLAKPTLQASTHTPEIDTQDMLMPLAEEADSEAQATPAPETPGLVTRFAPQAVVLLTLFVGLLGLVFIKPKQLPEHHS